jgi:SAM-dependent methyltransferase
MSTVIPAFTDAYPNFSAIGHVVTNECLKTHNELLGERTFERIAAICSGGELIFSVFLPRTTQQLIAVDHSYRAIASCYIKALLLDKHGPKETLKIMTGSHGNFLDHATKVHELLPSEIKERTKLVGENNYIDYDPVFQDKYYATLDNYEWRNVQREWEKISEETLTKSLATLNKLSFLHGDLADLPGEFDLIYISNALEHTGRDQKAPLIDTIKSKLTPDGVIVATDSYLDSDALKWSKLRKATGVKSVKLLKGDSGTILWSHHLIQKETVQ